MVAKQLGFGHNAVKCDDTEFYTWSLKKGFNVFRNGLIGYKTLC